MTRLTSEQILKEQDRDPDAVSALAFTHRTLSDVSCLRTFKNLCRLDLSFNDLSSLEGLSSCANLKWLSVSQNKLRSLKGIEGLSKLNVLNAAKNNLQSMNEVRSLVGLRALILNDNEIVSISKLDQMKELNTLVLSRNPVSDIGESLSMADALTKFSASKCQLQAIGTSLKSCCELRELRLACNDIKTLPPELAYNIKLQNLDLGNNLITSWSDMKMLQSLPKLRNLTLQGNPVAEKVKLAKVRKLVPRLQIFNAKPLEKAGGIVKRDRSDRLSVVSETQNGRRQRKSTAAEEDGAAAAVEQFGNREVAAVPEDAPAAVLVSSRKKLKVRLDDVAVIDDREIPFEELVAADAADDVGKKHDDRLTGIGGDLKKKTEKKRQFGVHGADISAPVEVGLGGASAWDDAVDDA